jgi:hypothetical protein
MTKPGAKLRLGLTANVTGCNATVQVQPGDQFDRPFLCLTNSPNGAGEQNTHLCLTVGAFFMKFLVPGIDTPGETASLYNVLVLRAENITLRVSEYTLTPGHRVSGAIWESIPFVEARPATRGRGVLMQIKN